jgi:uncharacterized membrane protein YhdT
MNLRILNLIAGIFHSVVLISLILIWLNTGEFGGVTTNTFTVQEENGEIITVENFKSSKTLVLWLILVFVFITALFHFISFGFKKYLENAVLKQNNTLRWVEYSVTSSLMLLALLYSTGEKQMDVLILSVIVNMITMLLGNVIEQSKQNCYKTSVQITIYAWVLYLAVWFILIRCAVNTLKNNDGVPKWIPIIISLEALFFTSFGIVQAYFIANKISFEKAEVSYTILSFVSKTLLALIVFTGVIQRPP